MSQKQLAVGAQPNDLQTIKVNSFFNDDIHILQQTSEHIAVD